jgi:hypothetical protein
MIGPRCRPLAVAAIACMGCGSCTFDLPDVRATSRGSGGTAGSGGTLITMHACSQAAFDAAYSSASPGDTLAFPPGRCEITWSGSTEFAKTNLVIQGQGTSNTILSGVHWTTSGSGANGLRITGIKFLGPTSEVLFDAQLSGGNRPEGIRIDHNEFEDVYTVTQWGAAEKTGGVIPYNCVVDNNVFTVGSHSYTLNYVWGDCDSTEDFPFSLGTADGVYFEDNVVDDPSGYMEHFIASRCGSRYVVRHNRFNVNAWDPLEANDSADGGGRANGIRGSWTTEIYENEFVFDPSNNRIIYLRGGQHVIWNNRLNNNQSDGGITLTSYNIAPGGYCSYEECTTGDKTCSDGRWCDLINHTYVWDNRYNCGSDMTSCSSGSTVASVDDNSGTVVQGADYFLSQAPEYSPLAYPHPRR